MAGPYPHGPFEPQHAKAASRRIAHVAPLLCHGIDRQQRHGHGVTHTLQRQARTGHHAHPCDGIGNGSALGVGQRRGRGVF